jgi:hypothetical protein
MTCLSLKSIVTLLGYDVDIDESYIESGYGIRYRYELRLPPFQRFQFSPLRMYIYLIYWLRCTVFQRPLIKDELQNTSRSSSARPLFPRVLDKFLHFSKRRSAGSKLDISLLIRNSAKHRSLRWSGTTDSWLGTLTVDRR